MINTGGQRSPIFKSKFGLEQDYIPGEKKTDLSQIAYAFLKDPLLKRIRTKYHPHNRHLAETMSIKNRKSYVLCCGSRTSDLPNQQTISIEEGTKS